MKGVVEMEAGSRQEKLCRRRESTLTELTVRVTCRYACGARASPALVTLPRWQTYKSSVALFGALCEISFNDSDLQAVRF